MPAVARDVLWSLEEIVGLLDNQQVRQTAA
jgi:hypothetical protein